VIGAMAGEQSLDKMGGFRKSMPFTFITFTTGALALAAFPLFSGFFSKDAILAYDLNRGGLDAVLAVIGYVAALMTAFYSFRLVFRVFFGDPVPEARELEQGHIHHGEHRNPATGELEDTDVGFPGPEHFVAEREWPMKLAMAPLAVLSVIAGVVMLPGITHTIENFLEPTFDDSKFANQLPSQGYEWGLLALGGVISLAGIGIAYVLYMRRRGETAKLIDRFHGLHDFLANKWYFDELYDLAVVRPMRGFGNFGRTVIESAFVQGTIVGGAVGIVRAGSSFARAIQSGYIRAYAGLLLVGLFGLALYFLIVSS
jgi:NADH-quinone oxidoreductase subunit L